MSGGYPVSTPTGVPSREQYPLYCLQVSDAESSEFHGLNFNTMPGFFASLQANRNTASATAQPSLRIYGDTYVPTNVRTLTSAETAGRKILAVRVNQRTQVNRQGIPYVSKEAWVFVAGPDGKPSTARVYLKLRNDDAHQVGQWLDPNSIKIANMLQGGRQLNGTYLQEATPIADDQVDPEFVAYCEANGIDLTV